MSLQVWLPLNGTLDNQGLCDVTVTNDGASIDNNGKIGRCYNLTNGPISISNLPNPKEISISFWFKRMSDTGTRQFMFTAWYGVTCELTTAGEPTFAVYKSSYPTIKGSPITVSTGWVHYCGTFSEKDGMKLYINGSLVASNTNKTAISWSTTSGKIGKYSSYASMSALMNDFRIYDHALSAKEVHEISKGLCLHYKLNPLNGAMPNLKSGTESPNLPTYAGSTFTKTDNVSVSEWGAENAVRYVGTCGTYIVFSPYGTGKTPSELGVKNPMISGYVKNNSIDTDIIFATNGVGTPVTIHPGESKFCYVLRTDVSSGSYFQLNMRTPQAGDSFDFTIWRVKFEDSVIPTPWCPNSADALYTALGYNNGIEYDCSGYRRNGTKNGNITCDIDSPRYATSYKLNTGSDYIKTNFSMTMNELSVGFWVKPSSSNGGYSIICSNYNNPTGGLWIATNCESCSVWAYRGAYMKVAGSLANDTWHHCVYTFKDGVSKWYINGEEKTITTNTYTGTTLPITDLTIGNSYTGTSWNTKRYGNLSDFRLYATALLADDVKELYEAGAHIDNHGNVYGYELKEE